jgi:uncharacterized membrane-anchored protein YitT (DUF2179 family)
MFRKLLQNRWMRIVLALVGTVICDAGLNLFIVPQGFYTGGLLGTCQLIRNALATYLNFHVTLFDLSGALYLLLNIPILLLAWRTLGKPFVVKTMLCTLSTSLFLTIIPIPTTPIIADPLTSCLVGGIICGFGWGLMLTCGASSGGLDIIGLYLSKKGKGFSVGKFSIAYNVVLFSVCLLLFNATTVIYSVIYVVFDSLFMDRVHQQNIIVEVLIFTKCKGDEVSTFIMDNLERGVTYWEGQGAYTGEPLHVLCVCMSKYEIETLESALHEMDPDAFIMVQEGVRVGGNFDRHLT